MNTPNVDAGRLERRVGRMGQDEAVVLALDYYQPLPLMDLDDEQLAKISILGNSPDEHARILYALWAKKNEIFPENLIREIREFCTSGLVWKHTSSSPALRARGVVWIVGLTEIGVKMFFAIRADDGSGKVWRSFLHDIEIDKLKNIGIETPNARAKGRGRTKLGETGQIVTPRPLERRVGLPLRERKPGPHGSCF